MAAKVLVLTDTCSRSSLARVTPRLVEYISTHTASGSRLREKVIELGYAFFDYQGGYFSMGNDLRPLPSLAKMLPKSREII